MACFKNPSNGYIECVGFMSFIWCLLFGIIYMAIKGLWSHIFVVIVVGLLTQGIGALILHLIYPFIIKGIIEKKYARSGWERI